MQRRSNPIWLIVIILIAVFTALLWGSFKLEDQVFAMVFTPSRVQVGSPGPEETEPPTLYCASPDGSTMVAYQPDMAWLCPSDWVKINPSTSTTMLPASATSTTLPGIR